MGPLGLLTIQRTLQHGWGTGLATGMGAAFADTLYGAVGAYGVTALINQLTAARVPLALGGGLFLLWLAWRIVRSDTQDEAAATGATPGWLRSLSSTFMLTLSNPATILSFIAVFGVLAGQGSPSSPMVMVGGVLIGSALWWLLLCTLVGVLRARIDARWRRRVNLTSAALLAAFALWQWSQVFDPAPAATRQVPAGNTPVGAAPGALAGLVHQAMRGRVSDPFPLSSRFERLTI